MGIIHGSADLHDLIIVKLDKASRYQCLFCPKGKRKRVTHAIRANGVTLSQGCEFHAYAIRSDMRKRRRGAE